MNSLLHQRYWIAEVIHTEVQTVLIPANSRNDAVRKAEEENEVDTFVHIDVSHVRSGPYRVIREDKP